MNFYTYLTTENFVIVINTTTAETIKFFSDDSRFEKALALIDEERFEEVFDLEEIKMITKFFEQADKKQEISISIEDGIGYITYNKTQDKHILSDALKKRIINMKDRGFDCQPMIEFIKKLYTNPLQSSIDELFMFMEANNLPITEDGDFIAYKIINSNYRDIYSDSIDNSVGQIVTMERVDVNSDRYQTCSSGLHFCSKEYLGHFGNESSICVLMKINPADVVSIPSDYNNAKGRCCRYEVLCEMSDGWRDYLKSQDFTDSSIITTKTIKKLSKTSGVVVNQVNDVSDDYHMGYLAGWEAAKKKEPCDTSTNDVFNDGYRQGYKDKKNHKAKKFK